MPPRLAAVLARSLAIALVVTGCLSPDRPQASTTSPAETTSTSATGGGPVGVVGCSVTLDAVRGYGRLGGSRIWPANELNYGLGTVSAWAGADDGFWELFEAGLAENPDTDQVWWQLCAGNESDSLEEALQILERLRSLAPEATIYVSAQPSYSPDHLCPVAGRSGPDEMAAIADTLIAEHDVSEGPDMGVLADERLRDNCHADQQGKEDQGRILLEFFG